MVPLVSIVVYVLDIVAAFKLAPVPLAFNKKKEEPKEEVKEEADEVKGE